MKILQEEFLAEPGYFTHYRELPRERIRRTILEWSKVEITSICLNINNGMTKVKLFFDTPPILGLLNGTTILHKNWGVIDYRNLAPDYLCDKSDGLTVEAYPACLEFGLGECKDRGVVTLFHEVIPPP